MKRIARIDFAEGHRVPWPGALLLLVAAAAAGSVGWSAWRVQEASAALVAATPAARSVPKRTAPATDSERRALAQVAAIAAQIEAPWFELLAAFEQHSQRGIGLLRLEPDARQMRIRVTAQARDQRAMLEYVMALEADPRLTDVLLVNHQVEADAPGRPIRFTLKAGWRRPIDSAAAKASVS